MRAAVANLEIVVLTDDGDRVYCLAARGVAASFRTFDAGGLELDATLRELSLTEAASGAVLLESFGDAASEAAAAAAGRAFRALPSARSQNLDVRDSLVAFSLRTFEGFEDGFQSFHTDCEVAFAIHGENALGLVSLSVGEANGKVSMLTDDVKIGCDDAVPADHEARSTTTFPS